MRTRFFCSLPLSYRHRI
ncbi:hypothetical protein YPPY54_1574, partial [Yersinia pestis PY-54]